MDDSEEKSNYKLVLIHQSTPGVNFGKHEIQRVIGTSPGQVHLDSPLKNTYKDGQVIIIPQYSSVHIKPEGTIRPKSWDGKIGGILVYFCAGDTLIEGTITSKRV